MYVITVAQSHCGGQLAGLAIANYLKDNHKVVEFYLM